MSLNTYAALFLTAVALAACGGNGGDGGSADARDYSASDLQGLSFAPRDLPDMDHQPRRSGAGAFTRGEENREIGARLERFGLEGDYVSQFFATSRDSKLGFVESVALLFEDASSAGAAVEPVNVAYVEFLAAKEIDAPALGEQAFGVLGDFDGHPVYAFGWRVGDAIQLVTAAPNGKNPGPGRALALGQRLAAKADARVAR
jgi:hypothetical protein